MNGTPDTSTPAQASKLTGSIPVKASELTGAALQRAYENALSTLDRDAAILDQLRSRANILLAALAIGVTALGAILTSTGHKPIPTWLEALLVGLLVLAILCCAGVLWPVRDHGEFTSTKLEQLRAGQPAAIVEARAGAASAGKALRQAFAAAADLEQVAGVAALHAVDDQTART